jgi:SAM-dependent methyltransferase
LQPGAGLIAWLSSIPAPERDTAIERHLGIATPAPSSAPPGAHLIGYHASGVAVIVRALIEVPVVADDVVVDLGAGLGKVVLLARLLTGAVAIGIELQPDLVNRARAAAASLGLDACFHQGDARAAPLDSGSVFFLYAPFTGPALAEVVERLHAVARSHAIVVCALGIDLDRDRQSRWLVPRVVESFWLTIYDSVVPGVAARPPRVSPLGRHADIIAFERSQPDEAGEEATRGEINALARTKAP